MEFYERKKTGSSVSLWITRPFRKILVMLTITMGLTACLQAKRSSFDSSDPSGALFVYLLNFSQNNVSYGSSVFKLIPGVAVNYTPTATINVDSWSINPDLPTGLTFNTKTGTITGTPNTSYLVTGYPLTTFTITATSGTVASQFSIQMQVLKSGENVWTVMNGASGGPTSAGNNTMKYVSSCNCIYIAGKTTINLDGQTIPATGGAYSGFLSKYNLDGTRIWTRVFGTTSSNNMAVNGLTFDSSENLYVTGYAGPGSFNGYSIVASYVGYIIKYDSNGNVIWTTISDVNTNHYYSGVVVDSNGDLIAGGTVFAPSINGMGNGSWTDQAIIVQKFSGSTGSRITGAIISASGSRGTDAYGVAKDSSGNIYLAAVTRTTSYCGDGTTNWRPALFRFNSSLTYLGCTGITTGNYHSFAFGVTTTSAGDSFISGYVLGDPTFDGIARIGNMDGFVTKFNSSGVKQWTKLIGESGKYTVINSVEYEQLSGNMYFAGTTDGNFGGTIQGAEDMFIGKYDSNGNQPNSEYWTKLQGVAGAISSGGCSLTAGPSGCNNSITFDSNKTLYSFGDTNGTIGTMTNPSSPNRSYFLVRNVQ